MPEYRDPATLCKDDNGGTPLSPQNWIVHIYERMRMSCLLRSPVCWHPASFPLFSSVFCMELRSGYFPLCAGSKRCALPIHSQEFPYRLGDDTTHGESDEYRARQSIWQSSVE